MWSIKQRRTKPRTVGNKVIYPKLNATATPNRYVNRNTYLDVKCNKDKGAGCTIVGCQCQTDASGNVYCCKTAPYRNPILGYRKHLLDCSATDLGCRLPVNELSGNVYKDNYAKSCGDPANSLVCYNPVIKLTQNRNGCVNESYNYSTNQYLTRRCLTFSQQEFNFQSQVPVDASGCCTKFRSCANCQYDLSGACDCSTNGFCTPCGHSQACIGINKLPCEVKNTKCYAIYKRSNPKFNHQGAVSGGSRINRLKYQTRVVAAQRRKANGRNNVINRRGPAALYTTSRPLTLRDTTCVNPPPGPVDLSGVDLSPFTFTINWSIANITELCRIAPLTGFTLQRTGSSFGHTVTLGSGSRTYTYTGIVTGSYNVRIKSDSYYGSSDWIYLNNIIVNFDPPDPITDLSGAAGNEQVELSWTAPDEGGSAITDYEYKKDSDAWISFVSLDTSGVITGLTNGTEYTFMVRAVNVYGNGPDSNFVNVTLPFQFTDTSSNVGTSSGWAHPTITSDVYGNLYAAYFTGISPGELIIKKSIDEAANWDISFNFSNNDPTPAGVPTSRNWSNRMDIVAAGGNGVDVSANADIYVTYGDTRGSTAATRGLMLNYNLGNSGLIDASWTIIKLDDTMKVGYVSIAVSGNGDSDPSSNVYISYQDHDNDNIYFKRKNLISGTSVSGSIYTTGSNWDSSIAIGPGTDASTNVFIVWLNGTSPYNVVFARSTDNGVIWQWRDSGNWATVDPTAALPTDAKVATGTYTDKAINISAQDNNNLYVSYTDSGQKLQLLKSTNGGESWSLPIEAASNVSYVNNMTITGTGATTKIYISYYYGGSVSDLGLAYSNDNGTTWYQHTTTTCVNNAKLNDITVFDDKVYIVADGDSGINQVICCKIEIS